MLKGMVVAFRDLCVGWPASFIESECDDAAGAVIERKCCAAEAGIGEALQPWDLIKGARERIDSCAVRFRGRGLLQKEKFQSDMWTRDGDWTGVWPESIADLDVGAEEHGPVVLHGGGGLEPVLLYGLQRIVGEERVGAANDMGVLR